MRVLKCGQHSRSNINFIHSERERERERETEREERDYCLSVCLSVSDSSPESMKLWYSINQSKYTVCSEEEKKNV